MTLLSLFLGTLESLFKNALNIVDENINVLSAIFATLSLNGFNIDRQTIPCRLDLIFLFSLTDLDIFLRYGSHLERSEVDACLVAH